MGNPRGVQRDFEELERRRLKAAKLLRAGVPQAEVARRVGVHRQSVSRWAADVDLNGVEALRRAGRAGRKPRLSDDDVDRLGDTLESGPEAAGYATNLWTCERVAEVIEREFGVRYHSAHVWRFLVRIGWSCQRPTGRALAEFVGARRGRSHRGRLPAYAHGLIPVEYLWSDWKKTAMANFCPQDYAQLTTRARATLRRLRRRPTLITAFWTQA